jgi:hypothetical protein
MAGQLQAALPTVDWRGFVMTNHSGLDPAARATPDQLLAILELAEVRHGIIALLPAAGWSGSLQSRLRSARCGASRLGQDRLARLRLVAGRLRAADRAVAPCRIALLITDEAGRQARDAVEVPGPAMRRSIDDFTTRARDLRDDLVRLALTAEQ